MDIRDLAKSDPAQALAVLKSISARRMKLLGPWEERKDASGALGWTYYFVRVAPLGGGEAIYNPHMGQWCVTRTAEDNQPDTDGTRESCDAYLIARGWTLIDLPSTEPAVGRDPGAIVIEDGGAR